MKNVKLADIIVPHHNRHDMLKQFLDGIDISLFNIIICSGDSFGNNCNKGAKLAETDLLIFCNDDIVIHTEQLIKMVNASKYHDFIGVTQMASKGTRKYWGIGITKDTINNKYVADIQLQAKGSIFPSGACFAIKKDVWNKLKGFDAKFKTGFEDVDLGIRAMEKGIKTAILDLEVYHEESQSAGRFDNEAVNQKLLYEIYPSDRLYDFKKKYEDFDCVL